MRLKDPPLLTLAVVTGGLVTIAGHLNGISELIWIFQPITTLLILAVAWQRGRLADHYAQFVVLGLALTLIVTLAGMAGAGAVVLAVLAVLAGLCWLWALTAEARFSLQRAPLLAMLGLALAVGWQLWPWLDAQQRALGAIVLAVGALMTGQAAVRLAILARTPRSDGPGPLHARHGGRLALLGAALLTLSAVLAMIDHSVWPQPLAIGWILAAFWAGQTAMALSVPERGVQTPGVG